MRTPRGREDADACTTKKGARRAETAPAEGLGGGRRGIRTSGGAQRDMPLPMLMPMLRGRRFLVDALMARS